MVQEIVAAALRPLNVFPIYLRPVVLVVILCCLGWFFFRRSGLQAIGRFFARGGARIVDWLVGLVLLPGYIVARRRRQAGLEPGLSSRIGDNAAEQLLDQVSALYEKPRNWIPRKRPWPTVPLLMLGALGSVPWVTSLALPPNAEAAIRVSEAFVPWQAVECWAGMPSDAQIRRARSSSRRPGVRLRTELGRENASSIVRLTLAAKRGKPHPGRLMVRLNQQGNGTVRLRPGLPRVYRAGALVDVTRKKVKIAELAVGSRGSARCSR